ncbi:hypothetical protein D3C76_1251980 [compost metagenome]
MRVVVIAADRAAPTQPDFPGTAGCNAITRFIDDFQFDAGHRPPGRGQAAGLHGVQVVGLGQGTDRLGTFGGAVELEEDVAEALLRLLELGRAHRRSAVEQCLQAGQIGL